MIFHSDPVAGWNCVSISSVTATLPGQRKAAAGAGRPLASVSTSRFAVGGNGVLPSPREHEGPSPCAAPGEGLRTFHGRRPPGERAIGPFTSTRRAHPQPAPPPARPAPASADRRPGADGPAGNSPRLQALDRRVGCLPRVGVWAKISPSSNSALRMSSPCGGVGPKPRKVVPMGQMPPPRGGVGCAMRIRRTHRVSSRYLPHIGHIRGYASHTFRRWR